MRVVFVNENKKISICMIKNLELLILNSFWYSSQFTWVSATKLNIFRNFFMNSHMINMNYLENTNEKVYCISYC